MEKAKYCGLRLIINIPTLSSFPCLEAVSNHSTGFRLNDNYSFIRYFLENSVHCNDIVLSMYMVIISIYCENYTKHTNVGYHVAKLKFL
jgi:hypothetical protein